MRAAPSPRAQPMTRARLAPRARTRAGVRVSQAWPLLLGFAALLGSAASAQAAPLESSRALTEQLKRAGRAEATLAWSVPGPTGDGVAQQGRLALEAPSFARLDVAKTGESVTLRPDGGEWLQPQQQQMLKLSPRHAGAAMRWWRLLASAEGARERKLAAGHYRLVIPASEGAESDSADVFLDARGLPARLRLGEGEQAQDYKLSGWKFMKARGEREFRLSAPPGVETVELP